MPGCNPRQGSLAVPKPYFTHYSNTTAWELHLVVLSPYYYFDVDSMSRSFSQKSNRGTPEPIQVIVLSSTGAKDQVSPSPRLIFS